MAKIIHRAALAAAALSAVALAAFPHEVLALFTNAASVAANTFQNDTLNVPTGVTASAGGGDVDLSWTATTDTYATGHRVLRGTSSGGPYSQIAEVTPRTTTTYSDTPGAGTFYYVVRAFYQNWASANSNEASATVSSPTDTGFLNCSADVAVTTGSGDNDGFETFSSIACANDGSRASDADSGTSTSTLCGNSGKDRHLFYNYGFSISAGSTINGIEVRLDALSSGTQVSPSMCVELSWDGGTTWTAAKSTGTLSSAETTFILGSSTDTWGRTWGSSEFSNADFRVRVTDVDSTTSTTFELDWVAVKVTYTP